MEIQQPADDAGRRGMAFMKREEDARVDGTREQLMPCDNDVPVHKAS